MKSDAFRILLAGAALVTAVPVLAGNALMAPGAPVTVAKSSMTVMPDQEWNRLSARPGRSSETWTLDGDELNGLNFYGGIESGRTLFREVSRKTKPLPHFSTTMLFTDIPELLERSYRIALDSAQFETTGSEPATFLGQRGVRFTYSFRRRLEDVARHGEAIAAIVDKKLYMITYEGPSIYYFDRDVASFRRIAASAKLGA